MQSPRISTTRSCRRAVKGFGIEHPPYDWLSAWLGVGSDPPGKVPGPEGAQWHVPSSDNIVSVFFLSSTGADGGSGTSQEVDGVHSHMFLWSRICGGSRDGWVADWIVFFHCRRRGYPEWIHIPAVRWMVAPCTWITVEPQTFSAELQEISNALIVAVESRLQPRSPQSADTC